MDQTNLQPVPAICFGEQAQYPAGSVTAIDRVVDASQEIGLKIKLFSSALGYVGRVAPAIGNSC